MKYVVVFGSIRLGLVDTNPDVAAIRVVVVVVVVAADVRCNRGGRRILRCLSLELDWKGVRRKQFDLCRQRWYRLWVVYFAVVFCGFHVRQLRGRVAAFSSNHGDEFGIVVPLLRLEGTPNGKRLVPLSVLAHALFEASGRE